ncbi:MAG: porin family protein [Magnetovibrio sp.]|nr:porin family protein [Magnetovibrio sp.]
MFLKKFAFTLPFATLLVTAPVFAQSTLTPSVDWSGHYIGLALGVTKAVADPTSRVKSNGYFVTTDPGQVDPQGSQNLKATIFNASLIGGLNRQFGNTVFGLETDIMLANFDEQYSSGNITYITVPGSTFSATTKVESKWIVSLRPRVGYARNSSLFYVSAGPALTRFKYDFTFTDTNGPESSNIRSHKTKLGWAASMGFEHKLQKGWALKAEYLFTNFSNIVKKSSALVTVPADGFNNKVDYRTNNIRLGLVKSF